MTKRGSRLKVYFHEESRKKVEEIDCSMSQECWLWGRRCGLKEKHLMIQKWVKRGREVEGVYCGGENLHLQKFASHKVLHVFYPCVVIMWKIVFLILLCFQLKNLYCLTQVVIFKSIPLNSSDYTLTSAQKYY